MVKIFALGSPTLPCCNSLPVLTSPHYLGLTAFSRVDNYNLRRDFDMDLLPILLSN